jgi:hypothetical protein
VSAVSWTTSDAITQDRWQIDDLQRYERTGGDLVRNHAGREERRGVALEQGVAGHLDRHRQDRPCEPAEGLQLPTRPLVPPPSQQQCGQPADLIEGHPRPRRKGMVS